MADFNWDALPDAPAQAAAPTAQQNSGFDWASAPDASDADIRAAKYGTPGQIAKTAAEQAVSGATLGLSKVAETQGIPALGIPPITTPEAIKGREEENPVTSTLANIGGTGAMIAGTGGLGEAGELGVIGKAGLGAAEGAAIGGVNQATDDWSQDKALDAGKILASAGFGAALGGGGSLAMSGLGAGAGKLGKAMDWAKGIADESAANGEGFVSNIARGFQAAGENTNKLISEMTDHFSEYYKGAEQAIKDVYDKAGDFHLNRALSDMTLADAQQAAIDTGTKVKSIITRAGAATEEGVPTVESALSAGPDKIVQQRLESLQKELAEAQSAREVHDALTGFATQIDKGGLIKFDKLPTAAQQADQEILHNVRNIIRGDLKNPDIWGAASDVFAKTSNLYSKWMVARKNFQRDFMKNRVGSNGQTIKVVDPAKVGAFFKDYNAPNQALKGQSLEDFMISAMNNVSYAEDYEGYQKGIDELWPKMQQAMTKIGDTSDKAQIVQALKNAKSGHSAGFGSLALLELLPKELSAPLLALQRYAGSGGTNMAGSDLFHAVKLASSIGRHVEAATKKIDSGARAIFTGSSSQARKRED